MVAGSGSAFPRRPLPATAAGPGKSPNENLNYSLPISQVLEAPDHKARFDDRRLISLPYLHGTQTYIFQDGFDLPLSWTEFARSYQTVIARHEDISRERLLKTYADALFPKGSGSESVLYSPEANDFRPRMIQQQDDGSWSAAAPYYTATDLSGDGSVSVANVSGSILLRLVRSDEAADDAFYRNSGAFMDLALKGLNLRRPVGTDQVRVTSLGAALGDTMYVDHYGRKWQQRVWAIPFMDFYLESLLLPTPDGYCALILYMPSSIRTISEERIHLLANQMDVSFTGTLAQWRAYLARRAWLPATLSDLKLDGAPQWSVHTKRFSFTPPPKLLTLDDKSLLTLTMGFFPEGTRTIWDVQEAWWIRDAQRKAMIGLWRRLRPPPTARLELRSAFDDMRARRDPYNGQFSRDSATTSQLSIMVDVPGEKAGLVSADVLYGVTLRTEFSQARELGSPLQFMPQLASAARIQETGPGKSIVPAQPPPSAPVDAFEDAAASMLKLAEQEDATKGRDLRGRLLSEDLRDALAAARIRFGTPGADPQQLLMDLYQQTKLLWRYWATVPVLRHDRELWSTFLVRNHRALDTPHRPAVVAAEKALTEAVQKGAPSEEWVTLSQKLWAAYVQERSAEARMMPLSDADYHPRLSPCPAPATRTSGQDRVTVGKMSRTPDEFYPAISQRQAEEGPVIVSMHVSAAGCAMDFAISSSSGSEQLDEAAQRYTETIEFLPAEKEGKPVSAVKQLRVMFRLADTEPPTE